MMLYLEYRQTTALRPVTFSKAFPFSSSLNLISLGMLFQVSVKVLLAMFQSEPAILEVSTIWETDVRTARCFAMFYHPGNAW